MMNYHYLLTQLIRQQITLRYRRTMLGYLWILLNPLFMMTVSAIVFSSIFKMEFKSYAVFLFSGMIAFNLFSAMVTQCGQSLLNNEALLKKIYVPKVLFPFALSITIIYDNMLMFISLFIIIVAMGGSFSLALVTLIPAYVILYFFAFGLALINSIASVYFRDLQNILGIFMQALIFLSPVYYRLQDLGPHVQQIITYNPLTYFIALFRLPILQGEFPDLNLYLITATYAAVSFMAGVYLFNKYQHRVIFRM